ncbi:MAG: hypothetical protein HC768_18980 [Acaryochloris sp. CRU_2_0]|nr:hypothetical protein [Acaryochloris sp. CRU_2_0]
MNNSAAIANPQKDPPKLGIKDSGQCHPLLCRAYDIALQWFDTAHQQCYTQREFHYFLTSSGFNIDASAKVRFGIVWGLMIATVVPQQIELVE